MKSAWRPQWRRAGCSAVMWGLVCSFPVWAQQVVTPSLVAAARTGDIRLVKNLLPKETAQSRGDAQGETALHEAAFRGDVAAAEALIAEGSEVNAADEEGITPLHAAAFDGRLEVLVLLIKSGADVRAADRRGFTALHYAASEGFTEIVKRLVEAGADLAAKSASGATPLSMAEEAHKEGVVDYLWPLSMRPAALSGPLAARKARIVITDENLRKYLADEADFPPLNGSATILGVATSPCTGRTNGGASSGWPVDSGARQRLIRMRNEYLDRLVELQKECAEYNRLNDTLDNNRPLEPDQVPLASRYEPSACAPTWQDMDDSETAGSFEGSRLASANAARHLAADSRRACSGVRSMEDQIEALNRELSGRR